MQPSRVSAPMRALLCVLGVLLAAGCVEPETYRLAVANADDAPATVYVSVFESRGSTPVASHTFDSVPPNETLHVEVELRPARTYRFEAHTLDLAHQEETSFRAQRGTWWLTAFVEPDGSLTLEVLRE